MLHYKNCFNILIYNTVRLHWTDLQLSTNFRWSMRSKRLDTHGSEALSGQIYCLSQEIRDLELSLARVHWFQIVLYFIRARIPKITGNLIWTINVVINEPTKDWWHRGLIILVHNCGQNEEAVIAVIKLTSTYQLR